MRPLLLSDDEWTILEQLCSVLEVSLSIVWTNLVTKFCNRFLLRLHSQCQSLARRLCHGQSLAIITCRPHYVVMSRTAVSQKVSAAGLKRLNHYYDMALANHYNIIATSAYLFTMYISVSLSSFQSVTLAFVLDFSRNSEMTRTREQRLSLTLFTSNTRTIVELDWIPHHWHHQHQPTPLICRFFRSLRCWESERNRMFRNRKKVNMIDICFATMVAQDGQITHWHGRRCVHHLY